MQQDKLFSKNTFILILSGLVINYVGVLIAHYFELPVFLDSVGTVLAAVLGGYLPGIIVGFFSNMINAGSDAITLYYGLISVLIAVSASYMANKGAFKKLAPTVMSLFIFAVIGGCIGSVLTWALYGLNIGEGISSSFAYRLYTMGFNKFLAQLSADFVIDLADKLITILVVFIILKFFPHGVLSKLPHGYRFNPTLTKDELAKEQYNYDDITADDLKNYRSLSLRHKAEMLIVSTAIILTCLSVTISYIIYKNTMNARYADLASGVTLLMSDYIDADKVDYYLATGEKDEAYLAAESAFANIKESFADISYMYVYKVQQDGCHVVFDLDVEGLEGNELGTVIGIDNAFQPYMQKLINGEPIDYVISNESYGWLLTVYTPLKDSAGQTVAYVAADIAMEDVISNRYVFIIRIISLLIGASILIVVFTMWFMQKKIVNPINSLAEAANEFAFDTETSRKESSERMQHLEIKTGDEIENLYVSLLKTVNDMNKNVELINEKTNEAAQKAKVIAQMQNNIIISFATMVENRDENTGDHIRRTSAFVKALAGELKKEHKYSDILTDEYISDLEKSAPLHDIGKIKIPDAILNKPGKLTDEEFDVIKQHTVEGRDILEQSFSGIQGKNYLSEAMDMAMYHHERWDGGGYPKGLKGEQIPLCARIMAIADVFDALTSKRSYKEAFSFEESLDIIIEDSGKHFEPELVDSFVRIKKEIKALCEAMDE